MNGIVAEKPLRKLRSVTSPKGVSTHHIGTLDNVCQFGVAELQADHVVELITLSLGGFIISHKLGHAHLNALLRVHVHHIHDPTTP